MFDQLFIKCGDVQKFCEIISPMIAGVLWIILIDDCNAEEGLDKRRSALAKHAIPDHQCSHSLWVTIQHYTGMPELVCTLIP